MKPLGPIPPDYAALEGELAIAGHTGLLRSTGAAA